MEEIIGFRTSLVIQGLYHLNHALPQAVDPGLKAQEVVVVVFGLFDDGSCSSVAGS